MHNKFLAVFLFLVFDTYEYYQLCIIYVLYYNHKEFAHLVETDSDALS